MENTFSKYNSQFCVLEENEEEDCYLIMEKRL